MSVAHALAQLHEAGRSGVARLHGEGAAHPVRPRLVLASGTLAGAMAALDGTVLNVAIPTIQADLNASFAELEWIMSAYSLVFAALLVLFGTLGDAYGHRRFMLWGVAVFVGGSVMAAVSTSAEMLIAARLVTGLGAAMQIPTHIAAVVAVFPPQRRNAAIGIAIAGASAGLALGPLIGGVLVEVASWRWIFWLNLPLGLLTLALTALYVPAAGGRGAVGSLDVPGVVLLGGGLSGLIYALVQSTVGGWGEGSVIAAAAAGGALSAGFVARELRARSPLLDLSILRRPAFGGTIAVSALLSFGLFSVFLFISIYYQSVRGLDAVETGLLYLPSTLLLIVLSPFSGRIAERVGAHRLVPGGVLVAAAGLGLFGTITPSTSIAVLAAAQLLIGVGVGLSLPSLSTATLGAVAPEQSGMASSVLRTSREVAGIFGVVAVGAIVVAFGRSAFRSELAASALPEPVARAAANVNPLGHAGELARALPAGDVNAVAALASEAAATGIAHALAICAALIAASAPLAWRALRPGPADVDVAEAAPQEAR